MLCVCVRGVIDVFSVCNVTRGAIGAREMLRMCCLF